MVVSLKEEKKFGDNSGEGEQEWNEQTGRNQKVNKDQGRRINRLTMHSLLKMKWWPKFDV